MLPEPEASIVQAYLLDGGRILRVRTGVRGHVVGMHEISALSGMRGWARRFGIRHVPDASVPFIMAGRISVPAARAELVWGLVLAQGGGATIRALAKALGLGRACIAAALEVLEREGAVRRDDSEVPARFTASGAGPRWQDFIRQERDAA